MLRCIDKQNFDIQLEDTFRFPTSSSDFGRYYPYTQNLCNILNRTWEVIAFGGQGQEHCAIVQRRHDGITRVVALHWLSVYANPWLKSGRYYPTREIALLKMRSPACALALSPF